MRKCSKCGKKKTEDAFSFKNKKRAIKQSWCKDCYKAANSKHYRDNKDAYLARAIKFRTGRKKEIQRQLKAYFKEYPCVDCGEKDPVVLTFDHTRDKEDCVGTMVHNCSPWEKIKNEIDKCEVRCFNCHVRKTAKDFGWWK
ncbi:hypothetical protein LCGC14_1053660 [marine sediment metagenome]|uniref:HNH endonuclease n=1 Tax=marine sediment metagenome TaxID=412755 RepID=A0A0F9MN22_9ZZZZ